MHTDFSPPGPLWQTLNALLHREPLASVFYGLFWSLGLLFATPLAVAALQIFVLFNLFYWFIGTSRRIQYHPKQQQQSKQLAVVITGCDSGFGKELALVAEQAGYVVFAGCLSQESFVHFAHTSVQPLLMDVTSEKHVRQAVQAVENWKANAAADERVLHCLVCNAGIGVLAPIDLMDISDIRKIMEVNYFGMVRCCKAFLPILKKQSIDGSHTASRILNVASMAGKVTGFGLATAYNASKHAAVAFSHGLRVDMAPFGIQVCCICPSFHGTPIVNGMTDGLERYWQSLSKEKTVEYGPAYFRFLVLQSRLAQCFTWRMQVVVDDLMALLAARSVPAERIIGSDARFGLILMRMVPHAVVDLVQQWIPPRPLPACMQEKKGSR